MRFSYLFALAFVPAVLGQFMSVQLHPNTDNTKCLDVRGNIQANGTPVQIFDCNGTPAQQFNITTGATTVQLSNSTFCLDAGTNPANGTPMKIWECFNGLAAQQWLMTDNDRINRQSQVLCLDLTNGNLTNTNVVQIWDCTSGNVNQVWTTSVWTWL